MKIRITDIVENKRHWMEPLLLLLFVLMMAGTIYGLRSALARISDGFQQQLPHLSAIYIKRAKLMEHTGNMPAAFSAYQSAIKTALNADDWLDAALAMSEFLTKESEWHHLHNAKRMAREYYLALIEIDKREEKKPRLINGLLDIAYHLDDKDLMAYACRIAVEWDVGDKRAFDLRLAELDIRISLGEIQPALDALAALRAVIENSEQKRQYRLKVMQITWLVLEKEEWFAAWCERNRPEADPLQVREEMADILWRECRLLSRSGEFGAEAAALFYKAMIELGRGDRLEAKASLQAVLRRGKTSYRYNAMEKLMQLYEEDNDLTGIDRLLTLMTGEADVQHFAAEALLKRMPKEKEKDRIIKMFELADRYLYTAQEPDARVFTQCGEKALSKGWLDRAEYYLNLAESYADSRKEKEQLAYEKIKLAMARHEVKRAIYMLDEFIVSAPRHEKAVEARFMLLDLLEKTHAGDADLLGCALGAISYAPRDIRAVEALISVGRRLEQKHIWNLAEAYYGRASMLGSVQDFARNSKLVGEAMLGQARCMLELKRMADADQILRAICTNERLSSVWGRSVPLWSWVAFESGQRREGIRRWINVLGQPEDTVLAYVFEVFQRDTGELALNSDYSITVDSLPEGFRKKVFSDAINLMLMDAGAERAFELVRMARGRAWIDDETIRQAEWKIIARVVNEQHWDASHALVAEMRTKKNDRDVPAEDEFDSSLDFLDRIKATRSKAVSYF